MLQQGTATVTSGVIFVNSKYSFQSKICFLLLNFPKISLDIKIINIGQNYEDNLVLRPRPNSYKNLTHLTYTLTRTVVKSRKHDPRTPEDQNVYSREPLNKTHIAYFF